MCHSYSPKPVRGEGALLRVIGSAQGPRYDCLVGISGGKDSCYVAYLAKVKYGLRTLAVCYDFPFLRDLARENVRRVCEALGIELVTVHSRGDLEYRFVQHHFRSLASTGTTWGQCLFCHYGIDAILYNEARKRQVPFILGGVTKYELWDLESRARVVLQRVRHLSVRNQTRFLFHQARAFLRLVEQRLQVRMPGSSAFAVYSKARWPVDSPRRINMFDYVQWDHELIESTLIRETGWQKPGKSISWRYDCILEPLLDYTYKKEFGVSTTGIYLSNLVREGRFDRLRALAILEETETDEALREGLCQALEFLNLPRSVREEFLSTE